jgi:lipopolysaccharide/colanic/teichoic acid biosynthesis glycosyltransferase
MLSGSNQTSAIARATDSFVAVGLAGLAIAIPNRQGSLLTYAHTLFASHLKLSSLLFATLFALIWNKCIGLAGLCDGSRRAKRWILARAGKLSLLMTAILGLHLVFAGVKATLPITLAIFLVSAFVYSASRSLASGAFGFNQIYGERVLILGTGRRAQKAWRELRTSQHGSIQFLGFIDDCEPDSLIPDLRERYLGSLQDLAEYLLDNPADTVVVATSLRSSFSATRSAIAVAALFDLRVLCLEDTFEFGRRSHSGEGSPIFHELDTKDEAGQFRLVVKYCFDKVLAVMLLLVLVPPFLFFCFVLRLLIHGPLLLSPTYYGYHRRPFRMHFLNTGSSSAVEDGPLRDARGAMQVLRICRFVLGRQLATFLRAIYFDRVPQLLNVLSGEMSFVGPEAMTTLKCSPLVEPGWTEVFRARPGICRPSNLVHLDSCEPARTIALDSLYLRGWSLRVDAKLMGLLL